VQEVLEIICIRGQGMYEGKNSLCKNAKCPFFKSEYRKTITCEETEFKILFDNEKEKDRYAEKYCMREFPYECPIYAGIRIRYE
jgi:hypothetical protein